MSSNLHSSILTSAPGDAKSPSFSPDGRRSRRLDGVERDTTTFMCSWWERHAAATHTPQDRRRCSRPPQWSPMGGRFAFTRCNSERDGVYTVPHSAVQSRRVDELALHELGRGRPIWTPRTASLVMLTSARQVARERLCSSLSQPAQKRCLAAGSPGDFYSDDALSPDGRTVAFFSSERGRS